MENKKLSFPLEIKAVNAAGEFEGFASTFGNVDNGDDVVVTGAFTNTLNEWRQKNQLPLMTWFHDISTPIGDFIEMNETNDGLFVKGSLWLGEKATDLSRTAHNMLTGTGPKAMSIGFKTIQSEDVVTDGVRVRRLTEVKLFEVAVVPFGMNEEAIITSAKSLINDDGKVTNIRTFEKALRDAGLSARQAKTLLAKGYNGLNQDCDDLANEDDGLSESLLNLIKTIKE